MGRRTAQVVCESMLWHQVFTPRTKIKVERQVVNQRTVIWARVAVRHQMASHPAQRQQHKRSTQNGSSNGHPERRQVSQSTVFCSKAWFKRNRGQHSGSGSGKRKRRHSRHGIRGAVTAGNKANVPFRNGQAQQEHPAVGSVCVCVQFADRHHNGI